MCGRYYLEGFNEDEVKEYYEILKEIDRKTNLPDYNIKTKGEIFSSDIVPIIANNKSRQITAFAMEWGYTLYNGNRLINARSETASEKKTWKDGMSNHRCLIPASYYFEWEKQGSKKVKHAIKSIDSKMMYMAGVYRMEKNKPVFSILTRDVAPEIAFIHDRMPVILPIETHGDWLNIEYDANDMIKAALMEMEHRTALLYSFFKKFIYKPKTKTAIIVPKIFERYLGVFFEFLSAFLIIGNSLQKKVRIDNINAATASICVFHNPKIIITISNSHNPCFNMHLIIKYVYSQHGFGLVFIKYRTIHNNICAYLRW